MWIKRLTLLAIAVCLAEAGTPVAQLDIRVQRFQLENGLRVVFSEDHTLPVVAVYVVYDVGARSEARGRTGFAHLFEHMMFEGSANVKKGELDQYVEANGGSMNGSTHPDYTNYFEQLPSNKLALALWLESDRMKSLAITPENLTNQKEAVKQERRLSFDNRPYATAIVDKWPQLAFGNWQSSHSLIGSFEDLNAATVKDVSEFFKTYYAPNNAVLVIVGDAQAAGVRELVQKYFGDIPSQTAPVRPNLSETGPVNTTPEIYKDALAKVPGVVIGYRGPVRNSPDYYAMVLLDTILTGGDSSRLQNDLVKGKKSVVQYEADLGWPFADAADYRDPAEYATFLLYKPSFSGPDLVAQYQAEIERIQKEGVTPAELDRARTLLYTTTLKRLETALGRAQLLGTFELFDTKPGEINHMFDHYAAVTPQEIRGVAQKYLMPQERAVLMIQPGTHSPASGTPGGGL